MDGEPPAGGKIDVGTIRSRLRVRKPEPGSFHLSPDPKKAGEAPVPPESGPHVSDSLVKEYQVFQKEFAADIKSAYYPSCSVDVSPSAAFQGASVQYVDIDPLSVSELRGSGYDARVEDATKYVPEAPVDLLILLNPQIPTENPLRAIKEGGFVIANNWHRSADEIRENEEFEVLGVINTDPQGKVTVDRENLEQYWQRVESFEEFKGLNPDLTDKQAKIAFGIGDGLPRVKRSGGMFVFRKLPIVNS